jgi:phage shock protein A
MEVLPSSLKDKTTGWQKGLAIAMMLGIVYVGAVTVNYFAPTILLAMQNIVYLTIGGIVIGLPALYCITNPLVVWGFFKTLSWKLTSFLIKMDPLSVMDRYVEYLQNKLAGLGEAITVLTGKRDKLDRKIEDLNKSIQENNRYGKAALEAGRNSEASVYGVKIQTDKSTLNLLTPLKQRADKNLELMQKLEENWATSIEQLKYQIQGKRAEYEIIKETFKGLKTAEDFINSDNDAAKLYGQSVLELENQVTQKMGYIEEFERKSKGIMSNIAIEKQANMDAGLAELQQYMQTTNLMLPDFGGSSAPVGLKAEPAKATRFNFNN